MFLRSIWYWSYREKQKHKSVVKDIVSHGCTSKTQKTKLTTNIMYPEMNPARVQRHKDWAPHPPASEHLQYWSSSGSHGPAASLECPELVRSETWSSQLLLCTFSVGKKRNKEWRSSQKLLQLVRVCWTYLADDVLHLLSVEDVRGVDHSGVGGSVHLRILLVLGLRRRRPPMSTRTSLQWGWMWGCDPDLAEDVSGVPGPHEVWRVCGQSQHSLTLDLLLQRFLVLPLWTGVTQTHLGWSFL